ncbi:MAG: hypothetical protein DKINENOH_04864 [bacterium]|nr:hypothetical protein [bacterium]
MPTLKDNYAYHLHNDNGVIEPAELDRALALGFELVAQADAFALSLGLAELGDIDLPPVTGNEADQARLRAVAPLYLASELESARLLPAAEMLAGLFRSGGLRFDLGAAAPLLMDFWRTRNERFGAEERRAFFARLFGNSTGPSLAVDGGTNIEFESLMIDFSEALFKLEEQPFQTAGISTIQTVRLRSVVSRLAANLSSHTSGMESFAARDILTVIKQALEILKQPAIQRALHARSVWQAVRELSERYLGGAVDITNHLRRGQAGMAVLAWLAEALPGLESTAGVPPRPDTTVIAAASSWLQASLALKEAEVR